MAQENYLQRLFTSSTPENERLRVIYTSNTSVLVCQSFIRPGLLEALVIGMPK